MVGLIFYGLSFELHNHTILFFSHKNQNPGLKTTSYSNLETGRKPVLFCINYYVSQGGLAQRKSIQFVKLIPGRPKFHSAVCRKFFTSDK